MHCQVLCPGLHCKVRRSSYSITNIMLPTPFRFKTKVLVNINVLMPAPEGNKRMHTHGPLIVEARKLKRVAISAGPLFGESRASLPKRDTRIFNQSRQKRYLNSSELLQKGPLRVRPRVQTRSRANRRSSAVKLDLQWRLVRHLQI